MCLEVPLRERGGVGIRHSAYEISKREGVSKAICEGSSLVVDKRMDLSIGANDDDVNATDSMRKGETIPRIVNVYNQRDVQSGE